MMKEKNTTNKRGGKMRKAADWFAGEPKPAGPERVKQAREVRAAIGGGKTGTKQAALGGKPVSFSLKAPEKLWRLVVAEADDNGRSVNAQVLSMIADRLIAGGAEISDGDLIRILGERLRGK
jgi:hypothetical protein